MHCVICLRTDFTALKHPRAVAGGRARLVRLASDCMGTASNPAKGGFVREALINQYPKLAALLEDALHKIRRDTEVLLLASAVLPHASLFALNENGVIKFVMRSQI